MDHKFLMLVYVESDDFSLVILDMSRGPFDPIVGVLTPDILKRLHVNLRDFN